MRKRALWATVFVAAAALVVIGATDVSAFEHLSTRVQVSVVDWYAGPQFLTSGGGFTIRGAQTVTLTLSCHTICYAFDRANVSAPFQLVALAITNHPVQYVNVTLRAPTAAYHGPLSITLGA